MLSDSHTDELAGGVRDVNDRLRLRLRRNPAGGTRGRHDEAIPLREASIRDELIGLAHAWDRAMVGNDAETIGQFMADDWTIIGPDGSVGDKAAFLALVRSGALSHDVMESEDLNVRVYGDTAIVTSRGVSGGKYQGQPFREVERSSSVFVRQEGQWRCVLTHLSRLAQQEDR